METKKNIKRIETIINSDGIEKKEIEYFDEKSRLIKSKRFSNNKIKYKLKRTYDDINNIIKIKSTEYRNNSIRKYKSIVHIESNFNYRIEKKIDLLNNQTEKNFYFTEPTINKTIKLNETEKLDLNYSLKGILLNLKFSQYNNNKQLIKEYTFEKQTNEFEPKVTLNESIIYDKYPDLKIMLEKFNFNLFGEKVNNELEITNFLNLKEYVYENGKLIKIIEKVICKDEVNDENLDLFITEVEKYDTKGMLIERFTEGCGDSAFSIPNSTIFEYKYNSENQLIEKKQDNNLITKYTYENKKIKTEIITEFTEIRFDQFGNYFEDFEIKKIIQSIKTKVYDDRENPIEEIKEYFNEQKNILEISEKVIYKYEYW
ncbi:MAG: hypothetical protein O9267_05030 [Flavobacterium sp.]|uniref:hypothetical protein n=1 Tax=Flavobacterium sp. TaxID=239 RepID=UPI0022BAB4E2|nr:hypothetical protein [Flavobacterium sp.]MCZ8196947.1 hypothetical protein [Flavobacterium sp.]